MTKLWIECCDAEVDLDELQTPATLYAARYMLRKCRSRAYNIKSAATSKCNPRKVDDLQTRIIPLLAAAIQDAGASVGRLRIRKIQHRFHHHVKIVDKIRKLSDRLESLAKKGTRFAEDVEVCLGDLNADHPRGDELVSASASKHRGGSNMHSPVTPRRGRKPATQTPEKETLEARCFLADGEVALKVAQSQLTQIAKGSKREESRTSTPYMRHKLLQPGVTHIRFTAGRGKNTTQLTVPVMRIHDDTKSIKITIGNIGAGQNVFDAEGVADDGDTVPAVFAAVMQKGLRSTLPGDTATFLLWHNYDDTKPVVWELFSGSRQWSNAMEKVGWCSLRPVDIADDERCDLADPMFFRMVHAVLASGRVELLHLGPPCASFSVAVSPPQRSPSEPYGLCTLSDKARAKVEAGTHLMLAAIELLTVQISVGNRGSLEQPERSQAQWLQEFSAMLVDLKLVTSVCHYCAYGTLWKKPTKFWHSWYPLDLFRKCPGGHSHRELRGTTKVKGKTVKWTSLASPYPQQLVDGMARASLDLPRCTHPASGDNVVVGGEADVQYFTEGPTEDVEGKADMEDSEKTDDVEE